jgi:hypothetical protein
VLVVGFKPGGNSILTVNSGTAHIWSQLNEHILAQLCDAWMAKVNWMKWGQEQTSFDSEPTTVILRF